MSIKEICILHALMEVKVERGMEKNSAFDEAIRQRNEGLSCLALDYLADLYKACNLLINRFAWFRQGANETVLRIQKG